MIKKSLFTFAILLGVLFVFSPTTSLVAQTQNTNTTTQFTNTEEGTAGAKGIGGALDLFKGVGSKSGFKEAVTAKTPEQIAGEIIKAALLLIGIIFGALVIYAGYLWMTARGNEEMAKRAKTILENAAIGIIIVAGAYAITSFIVDRVLTAAYQ